jgi:hypothetical protein
MQQRRTVALPLILCLGFLSVSGQSPSINDDLLQRIRKEESEHSQIMKTMHMLTDVYGPRLTGSPNHKRAAEWAIREMQSWGLENAHLEPWNFGHPGWLNERLTAHIISPVKDALVCEVLAWTPSTKGSVKAKAYQLILPDRPTQEQLTAAFSREKSRIRGRIVLVGKPQVVRVNLNPPAKRLDEEQLLRRYGPDPRPFPQPSPTPSPSPGPRPLTINQLTEQIDKFLKDNGALVRVNDAGREHGQIRVFSNRSYDVDKAVPTVVMRNEDFGRITRIMTDGTDVELEFNIVNQVYLEGKTSYNAIAEIPGTDKADEIVMLGGHLDSWHASTGATDNAIGCAIMMEAARVLKKLGVKPRRTIRVALWSGEEQGLLGSQAYVKEHFGSFEEPKPAYEKFAGYFNIDSGTGRVRGVSVFGPAETARLMREIFSPFKEDGLVGAVPSSSRRLGGSDHTSFNNAGLPGIGMGQDPIEYGSHTWHTNLDTYERILEDDVKKAAIEVAWGVYNLAMRDDLLPRFAKEAMPLRPRPAATDISAPLPVPTKSKPVVRSKSKTKAKARDRQRRRRN